MDFYSLHIDDWIARGDCALEGKNFHELLGDEKSHPDDFIHDCYVGVTLELIRHQQFTKAQNLYNRWAMFAGYAPINILSTSPLCIDIQSHILSGTPDSFTAERKCYA